MSESAPAYIRLKSQDIALGHTNEDGSFKPGFGPGTPDWEGRLAVLKEQRFVKGSKVRTEVANQVWSGMEQQYKDTNARYKKDNPDKSGIGLNIVGGQQIPTATWNKSYAPYIDFLNNPVEGKRMTSPRGGVTEYKDGEWYFQGEKSTLNNIADTDYITNYVPDAQTSQIETITTEKGGLKGIPTEVENSADFASDADATEVLNSWKERYKGMGFEYKTSTSGASVTITAKNGKKHVAKLSSIWGNRKKQAKALNKFIEENKI